MTSIKSMFAAMSNGDDENVESHPPPPTKSKGGTAIEKIYQKKTQHEHILLRPDSYIGSVERTKELMWIIDKEKGHAVQKEISFVPGLYKIFDEIIVNAADNKQRDNSMDCIKVDINPETSTISIWNNGKGIPVAIHKHENMYVPTMIFGHLLTSSNYDDEEEKVVGGRNGFGAKLCNIYSTKFVVETVSKEHKKHYKQTWADNMTKTSEPKIKTSNEDDFTKITFTPDLAKFGMTKLDDDIVSLLSRRAYDVAASTHGVKVFLNGERIKIKNFKDYVDLFLKSIKNDDEDENNDDDDDVEPKVFYESVSTRWEVAVIISSKGFQQMSFVNSIATTKGGKHVDYITDMIIKKLLEVLNKKNKTGSKIQATQVKSHIWVFINCLIVNPSFDSQTKENMTTQMKKFGSKCDLSDKFINQILKSGIIESVLTAAKAKEEAKLQKSSGSKQRRLRGVPKLDDANHAGGPQAHNCTLILTEGDSAKTLAVSGLSVIGRDRYGVFPLRGKLLNVREATAKQVAENAEIINLVKILGLKHKKKYTTFEDLKTLRYGKVMIMTDQDQDGSHIKGLIINFIHHMWPGLLKLNFLEIFITPIVKVKKNKTSLSFYSLPELEEWRQATPNHHTYTVKYYKGLGTSDANEAKEYFKDMDRHRIALRYDGQDDDRNILLAFSKKEVDNRKEWLLRHNDDLKQRKELGLSEVYLYTKDTRSVTYSEYVNKELVYFSNGDNVRSIPSLIDGLKPGQRKVLYTCIKRNDKREVKVAQLAGSVAEMSAYHHGEQSLAMTIVNLAQNYVGSNNINLLEPHGQFGTRLNGGKDAASARYIFTKMSPVTRLIFHPSDDPLLQHERDDNQKIEPVWYIPIIPMVLVNGSEGIGTGWRTKIPNYNPREIVENIRLMLDGLEPKPLKPWYKNFKGSIEYLGDQRYIISGEVAVMENGDIEIVELPVGTWTQTYKENLLEFLLGNETEKTKKKKDKKNDKSEKSEENKKPKAIISDYKDYSSDKLVRFVLTPLNGQLENLEREGLHNIFKLQSSMATSSMVLFDELGGIKKYEDVELIFHEFYTVRMRMYVKRKYYLQNTLESEASRLTYQAQFIVEKCSNKIVVENKQRKTMIDELIKRGYPADPVKIWKEKFAREMNEDLDGEEKNDEQEEEQEGDDEATGVSEKDLEKKFSKLKEVKKYDYLLGMSMWMLTAERKNQLLKQRDDKIAELKLLENKTPSDLWREDLDAFMEKLDHVEQEERKEETQAIKKNVKAVKGARKPVLKTEDTLPSLNSRRIEPTINDYIKKAAKAKETKERKVKKVKDTNNIPDEKDEFDVLVEKSKKTLKDKFGHSPELLEKKTKQKKTKKATDGLIQTKLTFKKAAPKSKKPFPISSGDEDNDNSSVSDNNSDVSSPVVPRERVARRVATKKNVNYIYDSDEDEKSESDIELIENDMIKEEANQAQVILTDSEDEEIKPAPRNRITNESFDSLFENDDDDDNSVNRSDLPLANRMAVEKRRIYSDDEEDDDDTPPRKTKKERK